MVLPRIIITLTSKSVLAVVLRSPVVVGNLTRRQYCWCAFLSVRPRWPVFSSIPGQQVRVWAATAVRQQLGGRSTRRPSSAAPRQRLASPAGRHAASPDCRRPLRGRRRSCRHVAVYSRWGQTVAYATADRRRLAATAAASPSPLDRKLHRQLGYETDNVACRTRKTDRTAVHHLVNALA